MKNIKLFEEYNTRFNRSDTNDVYAVMTQELQDSKSNKKHIAMSHDAYHFSYSNSDELKKLKDKYPVGGKYKGETIIQTTTLNSKHIGY